MRPGSLTSLPFCTGLAARIGSKSLSGCTCSVTPADSAFQPRANWSSTLSYEDRVASLEEFIGDRADEDGVEDVLIGAAGRDWFFAMLSGTSQDQLSGLAGQEMIHELE